MRVLRAIGVAVVVVPVSLIMLAAAWLVVATAVDIARALL